MPALLRLYQLLTRSAKPALSRLLRKRMKRGKEDPARISERKGIPSRDRPEGPLVWIHAASVGESQSALILVRALEKTGFNILVTTGTLTSARLMTQRLPPKAIHQFITIDHPDWVARFLDHWKPDLALWMESELWPNMLTAIKKQGIPAVLVNARLSEKSYRLWKKAPGMALALLSAFSRILAQTEADAERFRDLCKNIGTDHILNTDNIKYSADPLPCDPLALSVLKLTIRNRPVWVYASTHAGEESLACRMHLRLKETLPDLLTIIVPRHPERRESIVQTISEHGLKFRARSDNLALPTPDDDLYLADTMGELGVFYSLCPVAMIGRSFSQDGGGGHNPVEAAQLGCAVITGPNNQNQTQIYADMLACDAVSVARNEAELYDILEKLLAHPLLLKESQDKALSFVRDKAGVIDRVMEQLAPCLKPLETRHAL